MITELARVQRHVTVNRNEGHHYEDIVLVHNDLQVREYGLARVQPGDRVTNTDLVLALTRQEIEQLFGAELTNVQEAAK